MANLTAERNTVRGAGETIALTVNSATIYAGALVGINAAGLAVPAAASDCKVVGRAEATVTSGGLLAVRQGDFLWDNDTTSACSSTDVGKDAYVVDDHTVAVAAASVGSGHSASVAGKILAVENGGVMVRTRL